MKPGLISLISLIKDQLIKLIKLIKLITPPLKPDLIRLIKDLANQAN